MQVDIIVSFNDPLTGPTVLMHENTDGKKDPSLSIKVAVKSHLTLSLMDKETTIKTADAVIPFPDLQKIAFSFLFTVNSDNGPITGSISYILPENEKTNLYKMIPSLKEKLSIISGKLQKWKYNSGSTSLPNEFQNLLISSLISDSNNEFEQEIKLSEIKIVSDIISGTPDYLLKKVKKNLEYAVFDLFTERTVIISGKSRYSVEYGMGTLDFLIPHKQLRKIMYSEDYIDPAKFTGKVDLIGVSSSHEKKYLKEYVIINVDKFEVRGLTKGKRNYFKDFISKIKVLDSKDEARQAISVFTKNLIESTEPVVDLFAINKEVEKEKVDEITKGMDVDKKEAVIEIARRFIFN